DHLISTSSSVSLSSISTSSSNRTWSGTLNSSFSPPLSSSNSASEPSASAIADNRAAASARDRFSFCSNFNLGMALHFRGRPSKSDHAPIGRCNKVKQRSWDERQSGPIPHTPWNEPPGSSTIRSSPDLKAFGGQVMGSTARLRRLTSGRSSPVYSIRYE